MEAAASSKCNAEKNPKKQKITAACPYLTDELWEIIFKLLNDGDNNRYLEPLSVVSKQFLSITNRLRFSIAMSDKTIPFLNRLFQRFPNLTTLDLSKGRNLNLLLCHAEDFPLDFKSLNFSNNGDIHTGTLLFLSEKMKNLTSLTCFGMNRVHKSDLFFIADCFPLLEELDLSYPMNRSKYDFIIDYKRQLLALPKLRKINLSGNCIKDRQSINYLFKNCNLLEEVIMNDLISVDEADSDSDSDADSDSDSDNDSDSDRDSGSG
jgi:F-box and leucine-rich repeat protein 2/20